MTEEGPKKDNFCRHIKKLPSGQHSGLESLIKPWGEVDDFYL